MVNLISISNGYLGNADKVSFSSNLDIKKGARLEVGGVCKMASKNITGVRSKFSLTEAPAEIFDLPCP